MSGTDVARKILILAREAGYALELDDIEKTPFVPQQYLDTDSVEDFMQKVKELDPIFEQERQQREAKGLALRYVATFENGKASIGFKEVDESDPLSFLKVAIHCAYQLDNYKAHPCNKGMGRCRCHRGRSLCRYN